MAHLEKAEGFERERNFVQSLRFSELALTKLKKLKPRTLQVIEIIDVATGAKFYALNLMGREAEALECATERYGLWAAGNMHNPRMLHAAFPLIESLLHNKRYEQAALIARTAYEMIIASNDIIIPDDQRPRFLARGAQFLARATYRLAETGGIAPEGMQKAGEEAIALARKALEINTQLYGSESDHVADDMGAIADVLDYFHDFDDDEVLHLRQQAIPIYSREQGPSTYNVANNEFNLGIAYGKRFYRALAVHAVERYRINLEPALTHYREASRIYRIINHADMADRAAQLVSKYEGMLRQFGFDSAAAATSSSSPAAATTKG